MDKADFDPPVGVAEHLQPGLRQVLAPNPSPMTFQGTNSYILGAGEVAVIDPGPALQPHLDSLLGALKPGERISHIFVTHAHADHSALAPRLAAETGAEVLAFGTAMEGRSEVMARLAAQGLSGGGEGLDHALTPDRRLADGETVDGAGWALTALWTPGHAASHLCLRWGDVVFSGDLVMGWASTLVSPPDGDLTDFMSSTRRLADLGAAVFHPGHGATIHNPAERCQWLLTHRLQREAAIRESLPPQGTTIGEITQRVYAGTPAALIPAARRNVFAHLIDLTGRNLVRPEPELTPNARFFPL